jgi:hypothetical protein
MVHQSGRPSSGTSSARRGFDNEAAAPFSFGEHSGMKMLGSSLIERMPGQRP